VIVGIGIDLVSASRIKRILDQSWGNRFVTRVFGPEEISYCRSGSKPEEAFAARFAAKEAVVKALGTGFSKGVTPAQIIVRGGDRQKPSIVLTSVAGKIAQSMGISNLNVSLSHSDGTACAIVIAEKI
jgi:holo-[acyl-carrier protein] synthase